MTVKLCVAFGSVPCVAVPDSSPAGDSVRPLGSTPAVTLTVGGGKPVIVTWNVVPGVFSVNVAVFALVIAGGVVTRTVKLCVAFGSTPLVAVSVTGKEPNCVGVPDNSPADDSVSPGGSVPAVTLTVGAGNPVIVTWNVVPGVFSLKVAVFALVIAGGALTRTVRFCVASGVTPLVAFSVTGKDPLWVGVPDNNPVDDSVRPVGSAPAVTVTVGAGKPVIVTWNVVPAVFSVNVAAFRLVIFGASLTTMVRFCVGFGSVPLLAVSVTGKDPLCVGVPDNTPAGDSVRPLGSVPLV